MVKERLVSHEIDLKQRPVGMPTEDNFQLVKVDIPNLKDGESWTRHMDMSKFVYAWTYERN